MSLAGNSVIVTDLADDRGQAVADDLGGGARYVRTDVTSEADVAAAVAVAAAQQAGPLRAAITAHGGPVLSGRVVNRDGEPLGLDGFRSTLETYLTGTYNVLRLR
jgi:NAD(P)-dependent dehydrogenase (short-subunit alcohol dehydrogenase family)